MLSARRPADRGIEGRLLAPRESLVRRERRPAVGEVIATRPRQESSFYGNRV